MASSINSTSAGNGGLVSTGDDSGILNIQTNETTAITVNASQQVGIGTTSPASPLQINTAGVNTTVQINSTDANGGYGANLSLNNTGTGGRQYVIYSTSNADGDVGGGKFKITDATAGATRMFINSSGQLLINTSTVYNTATTNVGFVGNVGSGISVNTTTATNGATFQVFLSTGSLIGSISNNNNTGVLYNVTSDYRLKNNAVALTGAKDFVMALKPKAWDWYNDLGKGVGFLAHEFMEVAKYSGHGEKDAIDSDGKPIYQTIQASSTEVMANIVALMQEQQATITAQAETINALTARIVALEGQ